MLPQKGEHIQPSYTKRVRSEEMFTEPSSLKHKSTQISSILYCCQVMLSFKWEHKKNTCNQGYSSTNFKPVFRLCRCHLIMQPPRKTRGRVFPSFMSFSKKEQTRAKQLQLTYTMEISMQLGIRISWICLAIYELPTTDAI